LKGEKTMIMSMTDYMLMKMKENEGLWTVGVDEYGEIVIINSNGQPCYGIEENGQIVTAETLILLFNEKSL
jgi:hypothetical protein